MDNETEIHKMNNKEEKQSEEKIKGKSIKKMLPILNYLS